MKKYSVVLPCYNEAHVLERTLSALCTAISDRDDVEVIVVVDAKTTDDSLAVARSYTTTVFLYQGKNISANRNYGARKSVGDFIYFLDADMLVPPDLFSALDQFIEHGEYDVLGFVDRAPETAPWFAETWSLRNLARRREYGTVQWLPSRNILVPRNYFLCVKGFNEDLLTSEDKDFVLRLGLVGAKVASSPEIILIHLGYERSFYEWIKKEFWRQHSHLRLLRFQGVSLRLLRFPLLAMAHLLLLLILPGLLFISVPAGILTCILWVFPSLAQVLAFEATRKSGSRFVQFWLLYFLRFHVAGVALLDEFFKKFQGKSTL